MYFISNFAKYEYFLDGYISRSRSAGMITPLSFEHTLKADLNDYVFQHTNTNKPVLLLNQ